MLVNRASVFPFYRLGNWGHGVNEWSLYLSFSQCGLFPLHLAAFIHSKYLVTVTVAGRIFFFKPWEFASLCLYYGIPWSLLQFASETTGYSDLAVFEIDNFNFSSESSDNWSLTICVDLFIFLANSYASQINIGTDLKIWVRENKKAIIVHH